jgi:hypothetical protein
MHGNIKATKLFGLTLRLFNDNVSTTEVSYVLSKKILINVAFVRIWKGAIVACLKTLFQNLAGDTALITSENDR